MICRICFALLLSVFASFAAQGSGIFFEAHFSQGKIKGDTLYYFRGTMSSPAGRIGAIDHDSLRTIFKGKEVSVYNGKDSILWLRDDSPVNFQYAVQPSFSIGYEKSFNKVLSIRGAIGYMKSKMDAIGSPVTRYKLDYWPRIDTLHFPAVDAEINSHWLSIPLDFKITLPIRRGGLYVALGPKATILLASKYTDNLNNVNEDLIDLTPRFNLALGLRAGAELAIANAGFLLIESGYHTGMINVSPMSSVNLKMGNLTLFSLGFRINCSK